jgi:hypothetical protein
MIRDYLFSHPEISNIVLFRYFGKISHEGSVNLRVLELSSNIARSMNLCRDTEMQRDAEIRTLQDGALSRRRKWHGLES